MRRVGLRKMMAFAMLGTAIALSPAWLLAQTSAQSEGGDAKAIARGKYLVEGIGSCGDCHTPFTPQGAPDQSKMLQGAMLGFTPTQPVPNWAKASSGIAGLPGWTDAAAVKFFMTGLDAKGKPARPPMPQYRYNRSDATAVVAYLKSLKAAK